MARGNTDRALESKLARADYLRRQVRTDEAMGAYQLVLLRHPDCVRALHGLGLCAGFKGRLIEAVAALEAAAGLAPLSTRILLDLAKTYMMAEMYLEGETTFRRVLKLDPNDEDARQQLEYCEMAGLAM